MLIRAGSKTSNGNATRQMEVELARLQEENWRLNQKIQDQ